MQHQPRHEGREEPADGVPDQHHHRPQQPRDDGLQGCGDDNDDDGDDDDDDNDDDYDDDNDDDGLQGGHQRGLLRILLRHQLLAQGVHLDPAQIIQRLGPPLNDVILREVENPVTFCGEKNYTK